VQAAARVLRRDPRARVTEPVLRQLAALGRDRGGIESVVLGNGALARAVAPSLFDAPATQPLVKDTCALTMLSAGVKENVVPARASATFDCRILPGTDPRAFHDEMLALVADPRVTLTVFQAIAATGSNPDHALLDAWRARLKQEAPAMVVAPILSRGATDCRFVRAAGVPCYGFMPVHVTPEELDRLHGKDEQLRVVELEKGLQRMVGVVSFVARTQ
jgi:carboxypeptidase PM20D1